MNTQLFAGHESDIAAIEAEPKPTHNEVCESFIEYVKAVLKELETGKNKFGEWMEDYKPLTLEEATDKIIYNVKFRFPRS